MRITLATIEINSRKRFFSRDGALLALTYLFRHPVKFVWRAGFKIRQLISPYYPCLAPGAVAFLKKELSEKNRVVGEWGSGKSTIWLAQRSKRVVAIEHDPEWHRAVLDEAKKNKCENLTLKLVEKSADLYPKALAEKELFDITIVDGICRAECMETAKRITKKGGYILLDDADREEYKFFVGSIDGKVARFRGGARCTDVFRVPHKE